MTCFTKCLSYITEFEWKFIFAVIPSSILDNDILPYFLHDTTAVNVITEHVRYKEHKFEVVTMRFLIRA